jgi:hypothetical protein
VDSTEATCTYPDETTKYAVEAAGGTYQVQVDLLLPSDPNRFAFYAIAENLLSIKVREPPQYNSIEPFFGTSYGGTRVTIRGKNLLVDNAKNAAVRCIFFYGRPVFADSANDTQITCTTNEALNVKQVFRSGVGVQYLNNYEYVAHAVAALAPRSFNVSTFYEGYEVPMTLSTGLEYVFEPPPVIETISPEVCAKNDYLLISGSNFIMAGEKTKMRCRYRLKLDNLNSTFEIQNVLNMNNNVSVTTVPADIISTGLLRCQTKLVGNITVDITSSVRDTQEQEWSNSQMIKVFEPPTAYTSFTKAIEKVIERKELAEAAAALTAAEDNSAAASAAASTTTTTTTTTVDVEKIKSQLWQEQFNGTNKSNASDDIDSRRHIFHRSVESVPLAIDLDMCEDRETPDCLRPPPQGLFAPENCQQYKELGGCFSQVFDGCCQRTCGMCPDVLAQNSSNLVCLIIEDDTNKVIIAKRRNFPATQYALDYSIVGDIETSPIDDIRRVVEDPELLDQGLPNDVAKIIANDPNDLSKRNVVDNTTIGQSDSINLVLADCLTQPLPPNKKFTMKLGLLSRNYQNIFESQEFF